MAIKTSKQRFYPQQQQNLSRLARTNRTAKADSKSAPNTIDQETSWLLSFRAIRCATVGASKAGLVLWEQEVVIG